MRLGPVLAATLWAALPATAQQQITPDEFLDRAEGRTLTFADYASGSIVGVEQFLSRKLSVWAQSNGRCSYGHIELRGPLICFLYENFPNPENCWIPFNDGGELLVMSQRDFGIQRITNVSDDEVTCQGAPLS